MNKVLFSRCDAVFVKNPSNLFYFSGYENPDAVMILTDVKKYYITDNRMYDEVKKMESDLCVMLSNGDYISTAKILLADLKISTLGYEKSTIGYLDYLDLIDGIDMSKIKLVDISDDVQSLRNAKSNSEIQLMIAAQKVSDTTFSEVLNDIKEGMSEQDLASILEASLFKNGADGLAFSSIVAFGENGAKPHAHRSDRKLKNGELITLDFGAKLKGYCSDITRTVAFGNIPECQKDAYHHVLAAQTKALESIIFGLRANEIDGFARNYFKKINVDKYFLHSLGHGIGIDVHEGFSISPKLTTTLPLNYAFSVEPGLYYNDRFGIRIEDVVVLQKSGIINLTKSEKNLIIL